MKASPGSSSHIRAGFGGLRVTLVKTAEVRWRSPRPCQYAGSPLVNLDRIMARLSRSTTPRSALPALVVLLVSALGLALRIEHALTFDGPTRGSDYDVYLQGVRWMGAHWRPFDFDPSLPSGARYQPPLWFAAAAAVWRVTGSERAIATLSVAGWCLRQGLLARLLRTVGPEGAWAAVAALSLHAVLPLSVLIDGKVNPEGPHAALFTLALFGDDVVTQTDALIADVHRRTRDQLADLFLALTAERARKTVHRLPHEESACPRSSPRTDTLKFSTNIPT